MSEIESKIMALSKEKCYNVNEKTLPRIAKAKERFFGLAEWHRCPCYPPTDTIHGCGTEACAEDIMKEGVCHCNLYLRRDEKTDT